MAKILRYKVLIPISKDRPKRKDWDVGAIVTTKDLSKQDIEDLLAIKAIESMDNKDGEDGE